MNSLRANTNERKDTFECIETLTLRMLTILDVEMGTKWWELPRENVKSTFSTYMKERKWGKVYFLVSSFIICGTKFK